MKEYKRYERIGTLPHRSYYIPFSPEDNVKTVYGIVDRKSSSRFFSLDGSWLIKQHRDPETALANLSEELTVTIPVPSCLQLHGYDQIQYRNNRYPTPANPPHVPYENPSWHYRRDFVLNKKEVGELSFAVRLTDPASGRVLETYTTEPGVQVYSDNWATGYPIQQGCTAPRRSSICFECQHFPDSPNRPYFPSVVLKPGEKYTQKTIYKFGIQ